MDISPEKDSINFSDGWFTGEESVSGVVSLVRLQIAIISNIVSCVTLLESYQLASMQFGMIPSSGKESVC